MNKYVLMMLKIRQKGLPKKKPTQHVRLQQNLAPARALPNVRVPRSTISRKPLSKKDPSPIPSSSSSNRTGSDAKASTITPNSSQGSSPLATQTTVAPPSRKRPAEEMERSAKKSKILPKGLSNNGKSCFMNSTIQCLAERLAEEDIPLKDKVLPAHLAVKKTDATAAPRVPNTRQKGSEKSILKSDFAKVPEDDMQFSKTLKICHPLIIPKFLGCLSWSNL